MPPDLHVTVATRLRAAGQRYTPVRQMLVEILDRADRPLTIPDILTRRRNLAQSSAYRNLSVLERAEVVHRVFTQEEHARYELAEDLSEHHHHLICASCGRVQDVVTPPALERSVERAMGEVARREGFSARGHRIDLVGLCRECTAGGAVRRRS